MQNTYKREPYKITFTNGKPIGPDIGASWPGKYTSPIYWLARTQFVLPDKPETGEFYFAVDRHYEIYINGYPAVGMRNFFNGDEYLFAQKWVDEIISLLKQGENTIEIVVRSDPWQNKNYRHYMPMVLMQGTIKCGNQKVIVETNNSWEIFIIKGWRKEIGRGGNGTIHFEEITLPAVNRSILSGFSKDQLCVSSTELLPLKSFPCLMLWNDIPKNKKKHKSFDVVSEGVCHIPDEAVVFDIEKIVSTSGITGNSIILCASFTEQDKRPFGIAVSAMVHTRIEFNGQMTFERDEVPNVHQMSLPDYLVPAGESAALLKKNNLKIEVFRTPRGWMPVRLSLFGLNAATISAMWSVNNELVVKPEAEKLELSEAIGAKIVNGSIEDGLPYTIMDFHHVIQGKLSFRVHAEEEGYIYLAYGFFCSNDVVDCHRMRLRAVDVIHVQAGESFYQAFDVRVFRFLDIIFKGFKNAVKVPDISIEEPVFLEEKNRHIGTSDKKIDSIWKASLKTAQLCCDELFVDNPEREHTQWIDAIITVGASGYYGFGEAKKTAKAIMEIAWTQTKDGQLAGYAPGKWFPRLPLQCHMSLFALACHRHYMHTGDEQFAEETFKIILRMVEHWERHRGDNELITDLHTVFVDWGSHIYSYGRGCSGPTGALTTLNAYYLGVLKKTAETADFLNRKKDADYLRSIASSIRDTMRKKLYNPDFGLFRDGTGNKTAESNYSQTANVLAVMFGASPRGEEAAILTRAFSKNNKIDIIPANAFFVVQVGEAMFENGCDELAIKWIGEGFGRMVEHGPGTLWETWAPHASVCQGTGAGPAYIFSRYLAGLYPAKPGYSEIGIDPHPGNLDHLNTILFTPHGKVGIQWERKNNRLKYNLQIPPGWHNRPVIANSIVDITVIDFAS